MFIGACPSDAAYGKKGIRDRDSILLAISENGFSSSALECCRHDYGVTRLVRSLGKAMTTLTFELSILFPK